MSDAQLGGTGYSVFGIGVYWKLAKIPYASTGYLVLSPSSIELESIGINNYPLSIQHITCQKNLIIIRIINSVSYLKKNWIMFVS